MNTNLIIVSDLHFGEDLLPGASLEKQRAVAMGKTAFIELLRYHAQRRLEGRPWRLVVAGDLFDFMSVRVAEPAGARPASAETRRWGARRSVATGPDRMAQIAAAHREVLAAMMRFVAAGHEIDLLVGNHDIELLEDATVAELRAQLRAAGGPGSEAALARIRVVPWFLYIPDVAWIEHGHRYDEACSFEHGQAPFDPTTGQLLCNVDDSAVRYLAQTAPELDPHGTEEWGFSGYLQYALGKGLAPCARLLGAYVCFARSLLAARRAHRSAKRRRARYELHRTRVMELAAAQQLPIKAAWAADRLARTPVTTSARRLVAMLMLDRWMAAAGGLALGFGLWAFVGGALGIALACAAVALGVVAARRSASTWVGSQVPMVAVPARLRRLVEAPVVVFGHTHEPRRIELPDGGVYFNTGTWLPASRPGILRSFTHVVVRAGPAGPIAELRQWRDGKSIPFVEPAEAPQASARPAPALAKGSSPRLPAALLPASARPQNPEPTVVAVAYEGEASRHDSV